MPRERIGMSDGEVESFLSEQRWVVLATLDPDGSPWADLSACAIDGDQLCFLVARGSRSQRNIERDARVCCAADAFPSYYEIRGATVHGSARRIDDPERRERLADRLRDPGVPVADPTGERSDLYALELDDVFSFDFGKIQTKH